MAELTYDAPDVVLIGPTESGESTMLPLVAERTGLTPIELDDVGWEHYADFGYDHEHADLFDRAGRALTSSIIVLVLPDPDPDRSRRILGERGRLRSDARAGGRRGRRVGAHLSGRRWERVQCLQTYRRSSPRWLPSLV